jgi:hypothetical protein
MEEIKIDGKWTGIISLGKKYRHHKGKELYFELNVNQEAKRFSGTSIDIAGFGVNPDPASIKGTIKNGQISFIKQYSSRHFINLHGEVKVFKNKPGPKIFYTGTYQEIEKTFKGNWVMPVKYRLFKIIPMVLKFGGTWSMKRK